MTGRITNLGYWCARPVREAPDRVALVDLSLPVPREVSYGELDRRMDRVASMLSVHGVRSGDRVALAMGNRLEFVEVMFGAMRAGIVPVPLNIKLGREVIQYIIRDAACVAAVVEPDCNRFLGGVVEALRIRPRFALAPAPAEWNAYESCLEKAGDRFDPPTLEPDHPSFQPYTSGSTGKPKGVVLTHQGQLWWIRTAQRYWPKTGEEKALAAVPLYHKNAMAGAIKPLLHVGGSVVLLPDFEPRRFLRTLAAYRCTQAGAVPAVFRLLLQHRDLIDALDLSALKSLTIGSAPVQEELLAAVEAAFGATVGESYGLTEGGPVMIGPPIDGRPVPRGSCGVAWPEGEVKLVGLDGREHSSDGELWVRNPGVTPGFHNLADVNAERLRDGWLATGDLFHVSEDGFFFFKGRTDDMFNCGGENVYPKEVENLLLSHPVVCDAAVIPLAHPVKGHVPVAMVMLEPGAAIGERDLRSFCLDHGPAYSHPRRVVVVEHLPLNGPGKVDRAEVQRQLDDLFGAEIANPS